MCIHCIEEEVQARCQRRQICIIVKKYAFHHHHSLRYHPKYMHSTITIHSDIIQNICIIPSFIFEFVIEIQSTLPCGLHNEIDRSTEKLTKRIKQIEEEKMNKQSGSNRAASARPEQCILPEFSPLVLGGAPQPQPPPC